ncbi:MAG: tRNA glutamyl-Q(34) synthetase GluQRS [Propionibacteriaceae bacterium]|nr:tRNA glutamyl-Q(34) synthetase GluQRS [Propionibacteriaceae bacterium]
MFGRFAPTPSADLHVGNLRTALVAWLAARSTGREFLIRIEDLDQPRMKKADFFLTRQLADLGELGITHDGEVLRQSERTHLYEDALESVKDLVYECFCSRKDISRASQAPHDQVAHYPGTCLHLSDQEKTKLRAIRPPALRIRASAVSMTITDVLHGEFTSMVDDFVVRRGDGVFSYHFAVVVDDGLQGVDQVVRGVDLLDSSPRQQWLATRLGFLVPEYLHVPLVCDAEGRLAKRDGGTTLSRLADQGITTARVLNILAESLNLITPGEQATPDLLVERFTIDSLPRKPWTIQGF